MTVAELGPGGLVDRHLHAFEEALYVLAGTLTLEVGGIAEELAADDYVLHRSSACRTPSSTPSAARAWLERERAATRRAPRRTPSSSGATRRAPTPEPPYRRGHFDVGDLPEPSGSIGLAGFGGANVGGAVS